MTYPAKLDIDYLNGVNGFKLSGVGSSGTSVASAGDVNGDGFADVIVGAPDADSNGTASGATYVVFGKAKPFDASIDLSTLDGANGFKLSGVSQEDTSGLSVASAGDVNGDGFADLIVGAPGADPNGKDSGASYVVFGKAKGFAANFDLSTLNGTNGFKLSGVAEGDVSGRSVASAGDVNGDGIADLFVGAPGVGPYGSEFPASYVVFGKATGFGANLDLSTLNGANGFKLTGAEDDYSGCSVASAGDVNGDGFSDLIVGASRADPNGAGSGSSYVVFGKAKGFGANLDLSTLNGTHGFKINGVAGGDRTGISVASAGDVNGDGFADLIVGASGAGEYYTGASYVVFGKAKGFGANLELSTLNGTNGFKINGASSYADSGFSVASAGDVNGDGFADLIVGAPDADYESGETYVVFGKATGFRSNFNLYGLDEEDGFKLSGDRSHDFSGRSVASAGDVNGDGFSDLIVGAPGADYGSGASYVVFGVKPDTAVTRTGTDASQTLAGGDFNDVLSGLDGNDVLWGNLGKDKLRGGDGDDTLRGGFGNDVLKGGHNADSFVFNTKLNEKRNVDKIADFSHKNDTILLDNAIFKKLKVEGALKGKFFEVGNKAHDKNDYVIYDRESGVLSYDADGSRNKTKPVDFAQLDDHLKLKADDFLVI